MQRTTATAGPTRLISVPVAARQLGLADRTVYLLAERGELAAVRIGKRVLVPVEEIDRFIKRHTITGARP